MALMVTGHTKIIPPGWTGNPYPDRSSEVLAHHRTVSNILETYVIQRYEEGFREFISGMAIGADTLYAAAVLRAKLMGRDDIRLIAAVPFEGQDSKWPPSSCKIYRGILNQADHVEYVCPPGYAAWKMQKRNEWMVDRAEHEVLGLWDGRNKGGTWNCIQYARRVGRLILRLNPQTLKYEYI